MTRTLILSLFAGTALAACSSEPEPVDNDAMADAQVAEPAMQTATAELTDTQGNMVGTATVTGADGSLMVEVTVEGLPTGLHGAHIHTTGDCSATDFTSAGDHWNPGNTNHGPNSTPPNPHAGDIGNLEIGEDGTGTLSNTSSGSWAGLLDADGSAFVIHADADDKESQPSGNAGDRIACGVFAAS